MDLNAVKQKETQHKRTVSAKHKLMDIDAAQRVRADEQNKSVKNTDKPILTRQEVNKHNRKTKSGIHTDKLILTQHDA
ncbi:hypothetical protein DPMN_059874 [Dreissena polymorpha]|uniref:Uncharacterized protein n=1 Tax=Dreissena polymorpha TaxID=45954 RepID=A0A9D4HHL9_DREPO|nr:hypothetical protein DPMN_059874 [Dreissena polymorpha]